MTDTNVTELRPKSDPTGAQRQARFRKRRKAVVTVPRGSPVLPPGAPIAALTPPPQAGRADIPMAPRNGGGGGTGRAPPAARAPGPTTRPAPVTCQATAVAAAAAADAAVC